MNDTHHDSASDPSVSTTPSPLARAWNGEVPCGADRWLWPALLRVPAMAARPQRLALAFFLVVVVGLVASLGGAVSALPGGDREEHLAGHILDTLGNSLWQILSGMVHLAPQQAAHGIDSLMSSMMESFLLAPLGVVLLLIVALAVAGVTAIFGGAICRSQACEFSQQIVHPWQRQLAFALSRWKTLVGALLVPGVVIGLIWFILVLSGGLFFHTIPGLDLIGSLFFGLAGLISFVAVLALMLWIYAGLMLIPAASCEGTDAIDAAQRVFAYAIAKPLRLGLYQLIALVVVTISLTIASLLIQGSLAFASTSMATLAGPTGRAQLLSNVEVIPPENTVAGVTVDRYGMTITPNTPSGQRATGPLHGYPVIARSVIAFWRSVAGVMLLAYALSMVFCSGTLIYLFMRQLVDGQHHAELWTPDHIDTPHAP